MQDKSIDNALLALRTQIIRGKLDGLDQVEALLTMRGVGLPEVRPGKTADWARRNQMRALVTEALQDGPQPFAAIAAYVAARRPELTPQQAYLRADKALQRMRLAGLVRRGDGMWRYSAANGNSGSTTFNDLSLR